MSLVILDILLNLVPRNPLTFNVIGACIFVPENTILSENAKKFGLLEKEPKSDDGDEEDGGFGMSTPI
jgi:hypothetical protein